MKCSLLTLLVFATGLTFAQSSPPIVVNVPADTITFAIIGDYGQNSKEEGNGRGNGKDLADRLHHHDGR